MNFAAAVITVSDSCAGGKRRDGSGNTLKRLLMEAGAISVVQVIVPDEREQISSSLREYCDGKCVDLIITTGGTGLAARDVTPEATLDVIDREAPGFAEAIRAASLRHTQRAMLSRAVSGIRASTFILNFPGSPRACEESFAIIEPVLGHAIELLGGVDIECAR